MTRPQIPRTSAGERAVRSVNNLTHTKGEAAGTPFNLRPWQKAITRRLFGTLLPDGRRQYRTCLLMLPRKNGKTELVAAYALYGLLGDGEQGGLVLSAAADREQASLVFNAAATMVRNDDELLAACEIVDSQKRIVHRKSGSVYRAISAEAFTKHGADCSMLIYDELHAAPNRELWDVLTTSQGARRQPLALAVSTAGFDRHSILYELYHYGCRVRDGLIEDPAFLPIIYEAPQDADWKNEAVWHAANPALGDFRSLDEMRIAYRRAVEMPGQENAFRQLYLNQWTEQNDRVLPMDQWRACAVPDLIPAQLRGRPCWGGLDLATTTDLSALVLAFPEPNGDVTVLPHFWAPEAKGRERVGDRVPYALWGKQGHLTLTEGNVVDYDRIRADINRLADEFQIKEIGYDPWNATQLATQLGAADGIRMVEIRQGMRTLSEPTKRLLALVAGRKLRHAGHPVLTWNASNLAVRQDSAGNLMPDKAKATDRIDGIVALVMALALQAVDKPIAPSPFATSGGFIVRRSGIFSASTGE